MGMVDAQGTDRTDVELLRRARSGDEEALVVLCKRYFPVCRKVARQYSGGPIDADDLVQEGTLGLLEAVRRFDEERGVPFESYARRCITSKVLSALSAMKTMKRRANVGSVPLDESGLSVPPPEEQLIEQEDYLRRNRELLSLLSHSEHEVLRLYLRGSSYAQISAQLGVSQKSVDNALQRVRRKVRAVL